MNDLQRLVRAVKTIARLADKYEDKDVGEALLKHCSHHDVDTVAFAGEYLSDLQELYLRKGQEDRGPRCCECGGNIFDAKDNGNTCKAAKALNVSERTICRDLGIVMRRGVRTDTRYCSAKCRQRAYRKRRVTGSRSEPAPEASRGDTSRGEHDIKP